MAEARPTFEDFFGTEHARLFGVLCFVTGDRDEAEEIMQDAFELRGGDIERIQVSSVGVQSTGLVVTTSEQGEAWLLLHRSDVATLLTRLRGHDQLGGRADSA